MSSSTTALNAGSNRGIRSLLLRFSKDIYLFVGAVAILEFVSGIDVLYPWMRIYVFAGTLLMIGSWIAKFALSNALSSSYSISSSYAATSSYSTTASYWAGSSQYTPTAYLSAFHTASLFVTSPNTPCTMSYSTTDFASGVTISGSWSDMIKMTNTGVYNLQFSAATTKTTGTSVSIDIWLRKNGSNLSNTNTIVTLAGGANDFAVPAWNFFVSASAGDYYQLMFASPTTTGYLAYAAAGSTGVAVAVPSVILTVNRIA